MNEKEKALLAWHALTAILTLKNDVEWGMHLKSLTPTPHVIAAQFILLGSGCATAELQPDGDFGRQSLLSLENLIKAKK